MIYFIFIFTRINPTKLVILELWGCAEGYYMNQGFCYKYFTEEKSMIEAEMTCMSEGGILAKPESYTQAEFLESFITYKNSELNITGGVKIWLGPRLEDLTDDTYFDKLEEGRQASPAPPNTDEDGECVAMIIDDSENHLGWHRDVCSSTSYFICQTSISF